ncbi:hypothetical protein EVG20_g4066 [Dentipellis fragilis]|uniref:F-box domain-containing protein n=1 Tax=Dentipellis fragilis TaxID=205917 RepID=A0A4Y9Z117_9AGAM|nr:hypothetical protein EVG20_g4066 [Dentipellis fragilis]
MLSSLRSHYDTLGLSYISHLPAEVLVRIFEALRQIEPPEDITKCLCESHLCADRHNIIGWLKVTHVCRQWRQAALAYPRLWSDIIFTLGPQWRDEMLLRSCAAPISMAMRIYSQFDLTPTTPDEVRDILNIISRHLEHTRYLNLSVPSDDWDLIIPLLYRKVPSLEEVKFVVNAGILTLPPDIFGQYAPRLSRLSLSGWRIPCLSRLKSLELCDDIIACALALKHLSLPSTSDQQIHCKLNETVGRHVELIFPWLDSRLKSSSIMGMWISDRPAGIHIVAFDECIWHDDDDDDDDHYLRVYPDSSPILDLSITRSTGQQSIPHLIQTICRRLPLTDLFFLSMISGEIWDVQHWFNTFGCLEKVSEVRIGLACGSSFCKALAEAGPFHPVREGSAKDDGPLFFNLDCLTLTHISISEIMPAFLHCQHFQRLTLRIIHCDIDIMTLKALEDVVEGNLEWDGRYDMPDEFGSENDSD